MEGRSKLSGLFASISEDEEVPQSKRYEENNTTASTIKGSTASNAKRRQSRVFYGSTGLDPNHDKYSAASSDRRSEINRSREAQVQNAISKQDRKLELKLTQPAYNTAYQPVNETTGLSGELSGSSKMRRVLSAVQPMKRATRSYRTWNNFIFVVAVISVFFSPYRLAFEPEQNTLRALDLTMDLLNIANIIAKLPPEHKPTNHTRQRA